MHECFIDFVRIYLKEFYSRLNGRYFKFVSSFNCYVLDFRNIILSTEQGNIKGKNIFKFVFYFVVSRVTDRSCLFCSEFSTYFLAPLST